MSPPDLSRRDTLKMAMALGVAGDVMTAAETRADSQPGNAGTVSIDHIRSATPLINQERARGIMDKYGLDGLVASVPHNIYYLSSHLGIMQWMGRHFSTFAFYPRREDAPAALIVPSAMLYHLDYRPTWVPSIKVYTRPRTDAEGMILRAPSGDPLPVDEPRFWPVRESAEYQPGDRVQLALFDEFRGQTSANALYALKEAILEGGAGSGRIGYDDPRVGPWLAELGLRRANTVDASNIFKEIRLVKTEPEIALLREAARRNEIALDWAIERITPGLPLKEIEANHALKWGELGGRGKWLIANVNGLNSGRVQPGDFMKLDSVGVYQGYHGDVGRTVSVGDPSDELARRIDSTTRVSRQVYAAIKPGMKFREASMMFSDLMRQEGFEIGLGGPHNVGLEHTDQPIDVGVDSLQGSLGFSDLTFENGTVFTLDMPHNEIGWGTTHVEDMILIRDSGFEALSTMDTSLKIQPVHVDHG